MMASMLPFKTKPKQKRVVILKCSCRHKVKQQIVDVQSIILTARKRLNQSRCWSWVDVCFIKSGPHFSLWIAGRVQMDMQNFLKFPRGIERVPSGWIELKAHFGALVLNKGGKSRTRHHHKHSCDLSATPRPPSPSECWSENVQFGLGPSTLQICFWNIWQVSEMTKSPTKSRFRLNLGRMCRTLQLHSG